MKLGAIIAGKFRLERVIGRGSMGVVVEATDMTLGRRVAVKLILPHHAADPQLRGRFIREAHAMTRLTTEHIARVLEVGELEDGTLFLAMELLEGQSLEQLIQSGGPLPVADAVDLMLEALEAVAEAHEIGLVHRDLKPSNLFLAARKGRPPILKVLDFGIVKDSAATAKLTATGTLPGTPAYMAPEQIALEEELIDARADVWALGVTLFEILTGSLPFTGPMNVMLARIRSEAPPRLRAIRSDVAPELEAVIARCLSKRPADRFANASELAGALLELRGRGLVRSERGVQRQAVTTAIDVTRRARSGRETALTEVERQDDSRGRLLPIALLVGSLVAVVGFILAMQGRLSTRAPSTELSPAAHPPTSTSVTSAPRVFPLETTEDNAAPVTASSSTVLAPVEKNSINTKGRRARVVSARNTGDGAWRAWLERHRTRIEGCAANQPCPVTLAIHITKQDGKLAASVAPNRSVASGSCEASAPLLGCVGTLVNEPTPSPDLCPEAGECHADVLVSFD